MREFFDVGARFAIKRGKVNFSDKIPFCGNIISAVDLENYKADLEADEVERIFDIFCKKDNEFSEKTPQNYHLAIKNLKKQSKLGLQKIINCRPIYCSLDYQNFFADEISLLEENGITIDVSNLSEKEFMEFSSITNKPLFCEGVGVFALCQEGQNLKDYQIKMIADSGGLISIGLNYENFIEKNKASVDDIAKHIDYIAKNYGDQFIAISSFVGIKKTLKGAKNYNFLFKLESKLLSMGYSQESVEKIFFKNARRIFSSL